MRTFPDVLADLLRHEPGRPLVTFYDHATGERVELSVTTYANWAAKAASLLVEELGLERGDRLRIDLPPHWMSLVWLGGAWTAGLCLADTDDPDAVVCGPDELGAWAPRAAELPVLACSLLPLGTRFAEPVPDDVHDVGIEIWGQPDAFVPWDPPQADDAAHDLGGTSRTHGELWASAALDPPPSGARLLATSDPVSVAVLPGLAALLLARGSLVLVRGEDDAGLARVTDDERVTGQLPW